MIREKPPEGEVVIVIVDKLHHQNEYLSIGPYYFYAYERMHYSNGRFIIWSDSMKMWFSLAIRGEYRAVIGRDGKIESVGAAL